MSAATEFLISRAVFHLAIPLLLDGILLWVWLRSRDGAPATWRANLFEVAAGLYAADVVLFFSTWELHSWRSTDWAPNTSLALAAICLLLVFVGYARWWARLGMTLLLLATTWYTQLQTIEVPVFD